MQILDGKAVAAKVLAEVKAGVQTFSHRTGVVPTLAVVLVGDFAPSKIYVRNKKKAADEAGIASRDYLFPEGCPHGKLLATLAEINSDPSVHGILLQLPLPAGLDEDAAVNAIAPEKDADGLHPFNLGKLLAGKPMLVPCTPPAPGGRGPMTVARLLRNPRAGSQRQSGVLWGSRGIRNSSPSGDTQSNPPPPGERAG